MSAGSVKKRKSTKGRKLNGTPDPFARIKRARWHVQTIENVTQALIEYHGNLCAISRAFGITRKAVDLFIKANPVLIPVLEESREHTLDLSEWQLYDAIKRGEPWAIKLYLETVGRKRGYTRQLEVGGPVDPATGSVTPLQVQIILPANGRETSHNPPSVADQPAQPRLYTGEDNEASVGHADRMDDGTTVQDGSPNRPTGSLIPGTGQLG